MRQDLLLLSSVSVFGTIICDGFVLVVPNSNQNRYTTTATTTSLDSTTRRQSFGDLLGSTLLPIATAASIATGTDSQLIQPVYAADEYPFKVRCYDKKKRIQRHVIHLFASI
jgi:hypothetical protein